VQLEDKVAIVTGGARGIGAEYCRGLAAEGARVVVADILEAEARTVATEIDGTPCRVDVADESSVTRMVAHAAETYGRLDVLINNAAIFAELVQPRRDFDQIEVADWDRVMAVNLRGVWLCCKAASPVLKQQRSGSIINISSGTILSGTAGFAHYVTSKAAVWGLTRVLARELGDYNVRVNVITPGLTSSAAVQQAYPQDQIDLRANARIFKREQQPSDLVGTVIFLASDASAFITGQTFNVDGGTHFY